MLARYSSLKRSERLRAIGWVVLGSGLVCAAVFYRIAARTAEPVLDDTTALGYQRALQHQVGMMMGHFGEMLTEWQVAVTSPLGEALIIAACAALLAGYFFRVAWVVDQEEQERHRSA